jgi:hypothetical protein
VACSKLHAEYCDTAFGESPRLVIRLVIKLFEVGVVDDPKSNAEINGLKSLALDHLGIIATKLRGSSTNHTEEKNRSDYASWDEVRASTRSVRNLPTERHEVAGLWRCDRVKSVSQGAAGDSCTSRKKVKRGPCLPRMFPG